MKPYDRKDIKRNVDVAINEDEIPIIKIAYALSAIAMMKYNDGFKRDP